MEILLANRIKAMHGVNFIASRELQEFYPVLQWDDAYSDGLGHVPYTTEAFAAFAGSASWNVAAFAAWASFVAWGQGHCSRN